MYAYLSGKITLKTPTHIYLDCNGIGYHLHITLQTYSSIEDKEQVRLYTHLHVREDAHTLYGFYSEEEKELFLQLISVSGIGPSIARLILSSMNTNELQKAIIEEDVSLIQTVKGIGPKSAKRLVLELKDKVKTSGVAAAVEGSGAGMLTEEALAALAMLGFPKSQSEKAIKKARAESPQINSVEQLIKLSLKNL